MGIEATLYDRDDPNGAPVGTLTQSLNRAWTRQADGPGSGSVALHLSDALASALHQYRSLVRFSIDGTVRGAMLVEARSRVSIPPAETGPAGRLLTVTGRGPLAYLDYAVLDPELGVNRYSPTTRAFNFASTDYDDSAWTAAELIKLVSAATPDQWHAEEGEAPQGLPAIDPDAWWIWSRAQDLMADPPQPVGFSYFRKSFTVDNQTDAAILLSADDGYQVYLDDAEIGRETTAFMWGQLRRIDVFLDAGEHLLAVRGENLLRDSSVTNIAGFVLSCMKTTKGGTGFGDLIVHTDDTWLTLDYPAVAPTMTSGAIMVAGLTEAQARGTIPAVTWDFDEFVDSAGQPWAIPVDVTVPVRIKLLALLGILTEQAVDARMDPETLTLQMFNKGTMGVDRTSGGGAVVLAEGTHIGSPLTHEGVDLAGNDALVQYATGQWRRRADAGAIAAHGKIEYGLELGTAPSTDAVDRVVDATHADYGVPMNRVVVRVLPVTGAVPLDDWREGDLIGAPGDDDATADSFVSALSVSEPPPAEDGTVGGTPIYTAELLQESAV